MSTRQGAPLAGFWQTLPMPDEREQEAATVEPQPPRAAARDATERPREIGGPRGPEPTRYGDWERAGRCIDF